MFGSSPSRPIIARSSEEESKHVKYVIGLCFVIHLGVVCLKWPTDWWWFDWFERSQFHWIVGDFVRTRPAALNGPGKVMCMTRFGSAERFVLCWFNVSHWTGSLSSLIPWLSIETDHLAGVNSAAAQQLLYAVSLANSHRPAGIGLIPLIASQRPEWAPSIIEAIENIVRVKSSIQMKRAVTS